MPFNMDQALLVQSMNRNLSKLQPYPFEKLAKLKQGISPPAELRHIALSIGEPQHATPDFIKQALTAHLDGLTQYPATKGIIELRQSIADWLMMRFQAKVDAETQILPVNGTREALFSFAQCCIDAEQKPLVLMPNPFYQIYEGAALLAGAEPYFLNTTQENGFLPDFDNISESVWQRCKLLYICSPGNPTGAVLKLQTLQKLISLSLKYDFIIASDECYSELYRDEANPPPGLLQAASSMGHDDYKNCVVFHSLSKRSNAPGLRSGFVAGDADILKSYLLYRTYHGCALSLPIQKASLAAWQDEAHVKANRALYREKFEAVHALLKDVLDVEMPEAGFYLWPKTPVDSESFTRALFAEQNVSVVPGSYLSRESLGVNPGLNHIRLALVAPLEDCVEAANRIRSFMKHD